MLSDVGGIVDRNGVLKRIVIDKRSRMRLHVNRDERLEVVPGLKVQEPVPHTQAHALVDKVQVYIREKLGPVSLCDGCRACCKTPYIAPPFFKPSHQMCRHAGANGCTIYGKRPNECRVFECLWLKSQRGANPMTPELRPDRCGAFFTGDTHGDPDLIELHQDKDMASSPVVQSFIDYHEKLGKRFKLVTFYYGEN